MICCILLDLYYLFSILKILRDRQLHHWNNQISILSFDIFCQSTQHILLEVSSIIRVLRRLIPLFPVRNILKFRWYLCHSDQLEFSESYYTYELYHYLERLKLSQVRLFVISQALIYCLINILVEFLYDFLLKYF